MAEPGDKPKATNATLPLHTPASHRTAIVRPMASQQVANPRDFEITQVQRRFSPTVREEEDATLLALKLVPSDPDFPFELAGLRVTLCVPRAYPSNAKPLIRIDNSEMARGYQINVERGFDDLVVKYPTKTLLALMNELDKNLESFLTSQKARTVKLVANADKAPTQPQRIPEPIAAPTSELPVRSTKTNYTTQQLQDARLKREADVRQIEARMGRQKLYSKSIDGFYYNIPLQVPKTERLPLSLQSIKDVRLMVPRLYPLEACKIRLKEGSREAELVELAFESHATKHFQLTLMAHINHLCQNLHGMAQETAIAKVEASVVTIADQVNNAEKLIVQADKAQPQLLDQDRPHVQVIPRPPEFDLNVTDSDEESDLSDSDSSDSELDEEGGVELVKQGEGIVRRGIQLSFPLLELYNIELLQISSLSLQIQCERCKDTMDILSVKPTTSSDDVSRSIESCKKCASSLSVAYRSEPMHMNSIRAGYLDLEGCTVVDLLPSLFQPTCSECSTVFAKPGVVSVRGETSMEMCRECHKKMTFKLPDVKFLHVSSANLPRRPLPRKRPKEHLGIVAGTELPRQGRCRHYRRSLRWFRFSCCQKVYACDRCHDDIENHVNEHANRMICGFCSREQNYRPEDCAFCHSGLVGKVKRVGFWEGGKGTRDKQRMSKKDPRKYKRRGGGEVSAKAK